jgi:hypothetical protein
MWATGHGGPKKLCRLHNRSARVPGLPVDRGPAGMRMLTGSRADRQGSLKWRLGPMLTIENRLDRSKEAVRLGTALRVDEIGNDATNLRVTFTANKGESRGLEPC